MTMILRLLISLLAFLTLASCISFNDTKTLFEIPESEYQKVLGTYSDQAQKYDGPNNLLDVRATILNKEVIEAQLQRQASLFQWDQQKYDSEWKAKMAPANKITEVFVSFYTPDRKSGDLLRTNTLWKAVLKYNGLKVPGTPKKLTLLPIEINSIYPDHNRWSNGYILTFEAPLIDVEKTISELVISGPVGNAELEFKPIKN